MKQDTRTALLRAGKKSFARHGFDAAAVREITRLARTNLGAITYHFGTKRHFYHAVLEAATQPLANMVVAAARGAGTPVDRVRGVVRAFFEAQLRDPDTARLMVQELVLSRSGPDLQALPIRQVHGVLMELVKEGQAKGDFCDGDPALLGLSILSGALHMNLMRRALKEGMGIDFDDPVTREHVVEHVTAFACAGLARRN